MHTNKDFRGSVAVGFALLLLTATPLTSQAQLLWTVGLDDNGWPFNALAPGDGGGPNATFVQEAGVNPLPGDPASPEFDQQADDDYYFAGVYTTAIPSVVAASGDYVPVGVVAANEEAAERAFAGTDNDKRYHFNLPSTLTPTTLLSVTFDAVNLDGSGADDRYGIEIYVNEVLVQPEIIIRPAQLNIDYTTPQFTLQSVNAGVGPGFDNIVRLRGINYGAEGGGQWMGIDYVQLNQETEVIPPPAFPWGVGKDDDGHPRGDGGGTNTSFVQENAAANPLPGVPNSPEIDRQADDDYYFAGSYTTVIAANGAYTPVGTVSTNEEAAERAFTPGDNDRRYHFNLPNTMLPSDLVAVSFDALDLEDASATVTDPRYGVEVYFNGVRVQSQIVIRPGQLDKTYTTPQFSLASVNAGYGSGIDNIVTLKGIDYSTQGGGNWMGIDYIRLDRVTEVVPPAVLPWSVGMDDNDWPVGDGGGTNATFIAGNGTVNALPGNPTSTDTSADNDYYFGGLYTTVIVGNGSYGPVGTVSTNEEAAEGGFTGADNELRYHFNLPGVLKTNDLLSVTFDARSLDTGVADARYGVEIYFNGVLVQPQIIIRPADLDTDYTTAQFTLATVNAQVGPGFDNILTLKGISYSTAGGGNSLGIDYVKLLVHPKGMFPWAAGRDDNNQNSYDGGGPEASFVQENGSINALPGSPVSQEISGGADNDYYFAGEYTTTIPSVVAESGDYVPVGAVLVNEEAAERAFAAADNDLRFHFNLPSTLKPTNELSVSFDPISLDTSGGDPRYGIEVWVNGVKIQDEIIIRPDGLNLDYLTPHFTLASVNAQVGPGFDNIVSLRGINYNGDSGGNWMGFDYVRLNQDPEQIVFPWTVGIDDNAQPAGDGGGPNATFVQEAGTNPLPGAPDSRELNQQADDDYYLAGVYTNVIAGNGDYVPVGVVSLNEEAAERAFAGTDNDKRYHFNLPRTLQPTNQLTVTFDAFSFDTSPGVPDPRYGVEVSVNGVVVLPEVIIRLADLDTDYTTPPFTLASVDARVGPGFDNVITLRGVNYSADPSGGGNWMGIDYVSLSSPGAEPLQFLAPVVSNGQVTLNWTGTGNLEWAPSVLGPWTAFTPAPAKPYSEAIVPAQNRFYRLKR